MGLSTQQQILVEQRLANEKKSTGLAYLLWFFLGSFSAHRFYLGYVGTGIAQLVLLWGGFLLSFVLIGVPMLIIFGIWWIVDAFLISGMVDSNANAKRTRIINDVMISTRPE